MWTDSTFAYLHYIFDTLDVDADMLFLGNPVTDEFSHQFLGLLSKTDIDGRPNPYFDDVNGDGTKDGLLDEREGYIRAAYHEADETLGPRPQADGQEGHDGVRVVRPRLRAAVARHQRAEDPLRHEGDEHGDGRQVSLHPSGNPTAVFRPAGGTPLSNCRAQMGAADLAKACWAGGTTQIYVNPTLPAGITYEAVRTAVRNAFANLTDPGVRADRPRPSSTNAQVILKIMNKEELRNVDGTDSLHPNRSGDVVVVSRPPYQFDAATAGQDIAFSQFFGQHGYRPTWST